VGDRIGQAGAGPQVNIADGRDDGIVLDKGKNQAPSD